MLVRWIRHFFGLDIKRRIETLEVDMPRNKAAIQGAVEAFKQMARDAER